LRPRRGAPPRVRKENPNRTNKEIRAKDVRLVGEHTLEEDITSIGAALALAEELGLDLVEISPNAIPTVCKIMDYSKFLYDQKKKNKELKAKQVKVTVKEIRFGPNTDDHDFQFKLNHARKFLQEGSKVRAFVFFKGRTIVFKDRGQILLLKFAQELEDDGVLEAMPKMEGKKMSIFINPKKKK